MKMKHTPGPWRVQAEPEPEGRHPYHNNRFITCGKLDIDADEWLASPDDYIIAKMTDCHNQSANAQLIAAAPDMLEALRECITEDGAVAWRSAEMAGRRLEAISILARQVIAKAEGEQ